MRGNVDPYITTRVHGLRTYLITPDNLQIMAKSKSLKDVSDNLMKTDYAPEVGQVPTQEQDAGSLEDIFHKKLVQRFFFLRSVSQGKMKELLTRYCARFEVENIKRVIRAKHGGQREEQPHLIPLPREHCLVNFPALLQAKDVDEVVSLLRDTPYNVLHEGLQTYKEIGATIILEAVLDKVYFSKLWTLVGRMLGIRNLVAEEIDLKNLLTVFSLKIRDTSSRIIEEALIPFSYAISKTAVRALLQSRLEEAPNILTGSYSKLASETTKLLLSDSSTPLESLLLRQLYTDATSTLKAHSLEPGYVVAYLLLCEFEAKNLVSIVTGKQLNLSAEEISKGLFGV
jgi:vacuolar-type H+-ATPase subunit C/Vma6